MADLLLELEDLRRFAAANSSGAAWWSGVPLTNVDVLEWAIFMGWRDPKGDVPEAIQFLTSLGHKFYKIAPPNA